jgi:hypothetical protein
VYIAASKVVAHFISGPALFESIRNRSIHGPLIGVIIAKRMPSPVVIFHRKRLNAIPFHQGIQGE